MSSFRPCIPLNFKLPHKVCVCIETTVNDLTQLDIGIKTKQIFHFPEMLYNFPCTSFHLKLLASAIKCPSMNFFTPNILQIVNSRKYAAQSFELYRS